jgi:hypothetical protein
MNSGLSEAASSAESLSKEMVCCGLAAGADRSA